MWQGTRRSLTLAAASWLALTATAAARPVHKQALAEYFGPFLAKKLNDCRTCHLPDPPGAAGPLDEGKPHNAFGARLKAVKKELLKAGKKTTIADRLQAIAEEDSDGDGASNLLELLTGHFPGDRQDKPTAAELAEARQTLAAFARYRSRYPWRPFETVRRPAVPAVKNTGWVRNPVDAFIAAGHEEHGLRPRPEAAKPVLLRRVYLDLTGLPPTPAELHAFLADPSPDAYEKVVDRLLESPRYGERWGRHWMDVWRYSDWAGWSGGNQIRDSQPHIWRWRDWIVESLNHDKGYDRMVLEMLAADELAPEDSDALRATGYLVRNYKMLSREKWLQDTVDHTAQAFLGVTLGCARCHDHMFDPLLQKEYYQVRAVFEPHNVRIDRLPGEPDIKKDGLVHAFDADPQVKTFLYIRGDEHNPDKTPLPPGVPEALGGRFPKVEPVGLPRGAATPDKRAFVVRETLQASAAAIPAAQQALVTARRTVGQAAAQLLAPHALVSSARLAAATKALDGLARAELDAPLAEAKHAALAAAVRAEQLEDAGQKDTLAWKEAAIAAAAVQRQVAVLEARGALLVARQTAGIAPVMMRDEAAKKVAAAQQALAQAEANAKQYAGTAYTKRPVQHYPAISTGRRSAFAHWIADRDNPLTARVAMNHIWLRHFGRAIVPSVFDFGRNGRPPSHPALLDWLAAEFMDPSPQPSPLRGEGNTSAPSPLRGEGNTSAPSPLRGEGRVRGWRMKAMHRLLVTSATYRMASTPNDADLVLDRDNQYLWRMPSRRVEAEVVRDCVFYVAGRLDLTMGGPDIDYQLGLTVPRRSLYFRHAQEKQMEFLKIFDCAAVTECYQRKESVQPQQALALANSELTRTHAHILAQRLAEKHADPAAFITAAFEQVLARSPTDAELAECVAFLNRQARYYGNGKVKAEGDAGLRARENLVHVLLNHNDFVTIR